MHETRFHILLVLKEGASGASGVLERLRALVGEEGMPSLATFYRCLKAELDADHVEVAGQRPVDGPGRPAQIYLLTEAGERAVETEARRLESLAARARASGLAPEAEAGR